MLPGPQILSTLGIDSVPKAKAAIACAPPTLKMRCTFAISAATNVGAGILPPSPGGETMIISLTPATSAGMAVINTVDG